MKKIVSLSLAICLLAGAGSMASFAAKKEKPIKIKEKIRIEETVPAGMVSPDQPSTININIPKQDSNVKEISKLTMELTNRKTYRLGIRVGLLSPNDSVNITKDSPFMVGFDFDAKLNENFDTGPRITYQRTKYNNGSSINADYGVLMFGYGGRLYLSYWGDYGSTHGFFNLYLTADVDYCIANKSSDVLTSGISPSTFSGFAANAGAGLELAFGPNATGFVDVRYQRSSIKDSAGSKFPLDGFALNIGTRLAFF